MTLTTSKQLVDLYRSRRHADLLVSAHRGYRWSGVPENSRESVLRAAQAGMTSIEVDLRVLSDGTVVCIHDAELGRVTNIAEHLGRGLDIYNPLTGKGYNPLVNETSWDVLKHVKLKDELGNVSDEGVMTLTDLVDVIIDNRLSVLVLMDIKTREGVEACYKQLGDRRDTFGQWVLDWCIFKPEAVWHPSPEMLESEAWYQSAIRLGLSPLWIPVFDNTAWIAQGVNAVDLVKTWASRSYVVSIEIGLRSPGGMLQDVVDWMTSAQGPDIGMGFFGALGDARLTSTGLIIPFAEGADPGERRAFDSSLPPQPYEAFLLPGQCPDGIDHRADIDLYRRMGFSWIIADHAPEVDHLFKQQSKLVEASQLPDKNATLCGAVNRNHKDLIASDEVKVAA